MMKVTEGALYRAKKGKIYDDERPEFDCFLVTVSGDDFYAVDCWIVDEKGNRHPGIDNSPVPVRTEDFGEKLN